MIKTRVAAAIGSVLLVASGVSVAVAATATQGWRQADVGAARSRNNSSETALTASTISSAVWKRMLPAPPTNAVSVSEVGIDCSAEVAVPPVVLGTTVYAVLEGSVVAANATTGKTLWSTPAAEPDTEYTALAVQGTTVYAGSLDCESNSDPGGLLEARNASTGALLWNSFTTVGSLMTMVISNGHVIVDGDQSGEDNGGATVFNATTGATQWTGSRCSQSRTDIVVGGVAIMGGCDASFNPTLQGRALADGHVIWSRPGDWTPQRGDQDTTAGHDAYVLDPTGRLVDLNPLTGATRWSAAIGSAVAVDATRVYTQCSDTAVCAYTRTGPTLVWTHATAQGAVSVAGTLAYLPDGEVLVAATGASALAGGELWDGTAKWVAVAAGRVFVVVNPRIIDIYSQ
jgi:outer membrane protein assembly factor BamB